MTEINNNKKKLDAQELGTHEVKDVPIFRRPMNPYAFPDLSEKSNPLNTFVAWLSAAIEISADL